MKKIDDIDDRLKSLEDQVKKLTNFTYSLPSVLFNDRKWRYVQVGGVFTHRDFETEYESRICCENCGSLFPVWIKKRTTLKEVVNDICCPYCLVSSKEKK
jgi:hypothetical protein